MRSAIILLSLLLVTTRVYAVGAGRARVETKPKVETKPNVEVATKPAEPPPKLELKNKSSFNMTPGSRSPFWPIGFKPAAKISQSQGDQAGPDIASNAFAVSSITLGAGPHFAIINGKIMQEGQQFGLQIGSQTYQITVKAIEDGRVVLLRRDIEIIVPLRRK